jgi:hypothetical protein
MMLLLASRVHSAHAVDDEPTPADLSPPDDDAWSFDQSDLAPVADEAPPPGLSPDELAALERQRIEEDENERMRQAEMAEIMDKEGRQRRQNVRVMVQYPITVRVEGHPDTPARSRDLSATGIGFATRLPLELEVAGTVTVHFPEWNFTKEFVTRFVKPILAGRQVGVQFSELSDEEHERVVKEVFAVQRSQLQAQRKKDAR